MKKILNLTLILAVLLLQACSAQKLISIKLSIVDETNNGLPGAKVKIFNTHKTIANEADLDGFIELKNVEAGNYKITVDVIGYYKLKDYSIKLDDSIENLKIEMAPVMNLEDVNLDWAGGWATIEDEKGNIRCVRIKK
jgi:uncharacterized membrane protein